MVLNFDTHEVALWAWAWYTNLRACPSVPPKCSCYHKLICKWEDPSTREFPSPRLPCTRVKSICKEVALIKGEFHLFKPRRSFQNIIHSCGSVSWPWNMSITSPRPLQQIGYICSTFTHSSSTWKFGWSYTLGIMSRSYYSFLEHCSSQYYYSYLLLMKHYHWKYRHYS